jgi:phytoene dehydrogenase-like protein
MEYLDKSYRDAREYGWSQAPLVEMLIPSLVDDSLAPPGQHVASLFCQQFDPDVDWDQHRDAAAERILDQVEKYAPGFKQSVVGQQVLSPLDLERKFGLTRGDIMHGALNVDQMFSARPMLGHGDYRAPIKNLYMCGAGTHPGGGVTGAPGHNAAREILRDF